jgi:hypothetical protein
MIIYERGLAEHVACIVEMSNVYKKKKKKKENDYLNDLVFDGMILIIL